MKRLMAVLLALSAFLLTPHVSAVPVSLSEVPAYDWYHGCGPTAAASVIGYWDLNGYDNLFDASGWSEVRLTANVRDQISSTEHNARYDPTPDDTSQPESWNSIADWFRTSRDPLGYGASYVSYSDDAFVGYANYRGYTFDSWYERYGTFTWEDLVGEITAGFPMMLIVDCTGDGTTDHAVPTLGYDDRGADGLWYGMYTTWSEAESIAWRQFRPISSDYSWGVSYGVFVQPLSSAAIVPEPATILLIGSSLAALAMKQRRTRAD